MDLFQHVETEARVDASLRQQLEEAISNKEEWRRRSDQMGESQARAWSEAHAFEMRAEQAEAALAELRGHAQMVWDTQTYDRVRRLLLQPDAEVSTEHPLLRDAQAVLRDYELILRERRGRTPAPSIPSRVPRGDS